VAHSDLGEAIRIISARKTTLRERKHYGEEKRTEKRPVHDELHREYNLSE
jgi:uncharacterized DUF497 family protein